MHRTPSEGREAAARQRRKIEELPAHLQKELVECEEILCHNLNLVDSYRATAWAAAKRKNLVFDEPIIQEEARVEHKRQVLLSKRRWTEEETPVHCNTIAIDKLSASTKAGGSAGKSAPGQKFTS